MNFELASYYYNLFGVMGDNQYRFTHYENIYFPLGHATLAYIAKGLSLPHGHRFPIDDIIKASIGNKNKVPNIFEFFNGNPKLSERVNPNVSYNDGFSGGDVFLTHAILGKVSGIDFGRLSSDEIINHSLTYSRRTCILPVNNEYLAKMKDAYLDMRRGTSSVVFSNPASIPELRSSAGQMIEALQDCNDYSGTKGTFKTNGLTQAVFLFDILKNIMGDSDSTRLHALLKDASPTYLLDETGPATLAGCDWHSYMAIVCYYRLLNDKPGMKLKGTRVYQDTHPSLNLAVKILSQEIPVDQHFHNFFKYCVAVAIGGSSLSTTAISMCNKTERIPTVVRDAVYLMGMENGVMDKVSSETIYTSLFGPEITKHYYGITTAYRHTDGPQTMLQVQTSQHHLNVLDGIGDLDIGNPEAMARWNANNLRLFMSRTFDYKPATRRYSGSPYSILYCGKFFDAAGISRHIQNFHHAIGHLSNYGPMSSEHVRYASQHYYKQLWASQIVELREVLAAANLPSAPDEVSEGALSYMSYLLANANPLTMGSHLPFIPHEEARDISPKLNQDCFRAGIMNQPLFNVLFSKFTFSASISDICKKIFLFNSIPEMDKALIHVVRHTAAVSEMQRFLFGRTTLDMAAIIRDSQLSEECVKVISRSNVVRGFGGTLLSYALRRATVNS